MSPASVLAVSAAFKAGRYKSYPTYASKAKEMHIKAGHPWTDSHALAVRKATTSVLRGAGVARQSAPFDLDKALAVAAGLATARAAPVGWSHLLVVGVSFIMREIELAFVLVAHARLDGKARTISLQLPVSKRDPRAIGCTRSLACSCGGTAAVRPDCPYHAVAAQLGLLRERFGDPLPDGLPLFPTDAGEAVDKAVVVKQLLATIRAYGGATHSDGGACLVGGHSFRVTGAQRYAALGVEVTKIMILARWAGGAVLRYVRDAPLANLAEEVRALEDRHQTARVLRTLQQHSVDQTAALDRLYVQLAKVKADSQIGPNILQVGARGCKLHRVLHASVALAPRNWRTGCGRHFGTWAFTSHAEAEDTPQDTKCKGCFPEVPSGVPAPAPSCSGSSSSGSSSG